MYVHLGNETVVKEDEIIGIFDIETTTVSQKTRIFLEKAEKNKIVKNVSYELPKSFIVTNNKKENSVYISQISPLTLQKRSNIL
ncbi:MAG: DUF370 domain-containing protein [Clostridia bacterium]|nr:DUF370 domain-containing protein [Clostridia bacterium]